VLNLADRLADTPIILQVHKAPAEAVGRHDRLSRVRGPAPRARPRRRAHSPGPAGGGDAARHGNHTARVRHRRRTHPRLGPGRPQRHLAHPRCRMAGLPALGRRTGHRATRDRAPRRLAVPRARDGRTARQRTRDGRSAKGPTPAAPGRADDQHRAPRRDAHPAAGLRRHQSVLDRRDRCLDARQ
jgi:hypothetical protein